MNLPCLVCAAPVPDWDYPAHYKACVNIRLGLSPIESAGADPRVDRFAAWQRNALAGHTAWPPEVPTHVPPPSPEPPQTPAAKVKSWYAQREHRSPVPEGHVQCASCNGLTQMYPDCHACHGRGWL